MQSSGKDIYATAEALLKNFEKLLTKANGTATQESGDNAGNAIGPLNSEKKQQQGMLQEPQQQQEQQQLQQLEQLMPSIKKLHKKLQQQQQQLLQQKQKQQRQQTHQPAPPPQQNPQQQQQQQQPATNVSNYSDSVRFGSPKIYLQPNELLLRLKLDTWLSENGTLIVRPSIVNVNEEDFDHTGGSCGDRPVPMSKASCCHEVSGDEDVRPGQLVSVSGKNRLKLQLQLPLQQQPSERHNLNSAQFLCNLNNSTKKATTEFGGKSGGRRFGGDANIGGSSGSASLEKLPVSTGKRRFVDGAIAGAPIPTASAANAYAGYQQTSDREESPEGDGLALAAAAGDRQLRQLAKRGYCDEALENEGNRTAEMFVAHSGRKQLQLQMQQQQATFQQPGRRPRKPASGVQDTSNCIGAANIGVGRASGRQPARGSEVGVGSSLKLPSSSGKRRSTDCIGSAAYSGYQHPPADGYQANNHHDSVSDHISEYSDDENSSMSDFDGCLQQPTISSSGGGPPAADNEVSIQGHQNPSTDTTFALMQRLQEMINNDQTTEMDE